MIAETCVLLSTLKKRGRQNTLCMVFDRSIINQIVIYVIHGVIGFAAFLPFLLGHGQELFQVGCSTLVVVPFRQVRKFAHLVVRQRSADHGPVVFVVLHGFADRRRETCRWPEGADCQHCCGQQETNAELCNTAKKTKNVEIEKLYIYNRVVLIFEISNFLLLTLPFCLLL